MWQHVHSCQVVRTGSSIFFVLEFIIFPVPSYHFSSYCCCCCCCCCCCKIFFHSLLQSIDDIYNIYKYYIYIVSTEVDDGESCKEKYFDPINLSVSDGESMGVNNSYIRIAFGYDQPHFDVILEKLQML